MDKIEKGVIFVDVYRVKFMLTTTPLSITPEILEFCKQISKSNPVYLDVQTSADSVKKECFGNVQNFISQNGGSIQHGWLIWEWQNVIIEAEFHAVWVSPEGKLTEISPAVEKKILFLPDNSKTYKGITLNNIRHALQEDKTVKEFVKVCDQISEAQIKAKQTENINNHYVSAYMIAMLSQRQNALMELIKEKYNPA